MNNRPTILHLPGHLPYPITISSLLVNPDSPIRKHDGLLVYKFFAYETEVQDDDQTEKPVRKEMVEQFDSPWEGILTEWLVKEGTVVNSSKFAPSLFILVLMVVNLLSRLLNPVCTKFHSRIFAPYVEPIYQCKFPLLLARGNMCPVEITQAMYPLNPTFPCLTTTLTSKSHTM